MVVERNKVPSSLMPISRLNSPKDVATLLETYEHALSDYHSDEIVDIRQHDGYYFVIVDIYNGSSDFDFFQFLNNVYKGTNVINCINARLLFPRSLSRGIYSGSLESLNSENQDFSEDSPTGFLGDIDLGKSSSNSCRIYYEKQGILLEIMESGLVLGRSAKRSDFVITDNSDVSRAHCRLYKHGSDLYIMDLNSLNGTYVDGYKLETDEEKLLKSGNTISIAGETFKVK